MVGLAFSNSPAAMPAWNGSRALFGTNPIAAVFPRSNAAPLTIDLSLSEVARGKVMVAAQQGKPIPLGLGTRSRGKTDDRCEGRTRRHDASGRRRQRRDARADGRAAVRFIDRRALRLRGGFFFCRRRQSATAWVRRFWSSIPRRWRAADVYHSRVEALIEAMCADADVRLPGATKGATCATRGDRRRRNPGCIAGAIDRVG